MARIGLPSMRGLVIGLGVALLAIFLANNVNFIKNLTRERA